MTDGSMTDGNTTGGITPDRRRAPAEDSVDLEQRFLCADGSCIGVIGDTGRCNSCGLPIAPGEIADFERATGLSLAPELAKALAQDRPDLAEMLAPAAGQATEPAENDDRSSQDAPPDSSGVNLSDRVLCSDGNCIGVIGADGRCKVCHQPYQHEVPRG